MAGPRTALVTGATGLLGSLIAEQLGRTGWRVRALVRDPDRAARLAASGATCVRGDLLDEAGLRTAASGCDAIFHAAAAVGPGGAGALEAYYQGNVVGTARVIGAAAAAKARLVHVSSTAVYTRETRRNHAPVTEDAPTGPFPLHDVYGSTKFEAEQLVLAAVRE